MNLYVRMIWVWLLSKFRERLPVGPCESRLRLMTLPNDLDINFHMNNGRYLTIADLSRVDLFIRTGLAALMFKNKWSPIITNHTMNYKRSLKLFQKFEAVLRLTHWDDRHFFMEHDFIVDGNVIAHGTSKGLILGRDGVIEPEAVLSALRQKRGLVQP